MTKIICPFCGVTQKPHWRSSKWLYAKTTDVQRFECECGNSFNYYESDKAKWTIPKNPKKMIEK